MSARGWGERLGKGRGRGARRDGEPVGSACVYFQQGAPAVSLTAPRQTQALGLVGGLCSSRSRPTLGTTKKGSSK